jgi:cytochrome c oxidase subunit II
MVKRLTALEIAWTLSIVGLLAGVSVYSTILLYQINGPIPTSPGEFVDVIGHQWYWEFYYPANNTYWNVSFDTATQGATGGALWAYPGEVVVINVTASDVVHSFNIPALGVRLDAIPGRVNQLAFTVPSSTSVGTQYTIQCTEFCGEFHGSMRAYLIVI